MKLSWNVLKAGIAGSVCLSLLVACADRQGGFKAKRFTQQEILDWELKNGKQRAGTPPVGTGQDGETNRRGDQRTAGEPANTGVTPNQEQNPLVVTPSAPTQTAPANPESAQPQVITEPGAQPSGRGQRETLIEGNRELLNTKSESAVNLVKGVTVTVTGRTGELDITVDAVVMLGSAVNLVSVGKTRITHDEQGRASILEYTRKDINGAQHGKTDDLMIGAVCLDQKCETIHVNLVFKVSSSGQVVNAVFEVGIVGRYYQIKDSNLKEALKSYTEAVRALQSEAGGTQPTGQGQQGQQGQGQPAQGQPAASGASGDLAPAGVQQQEQPQQQPQTAQSPATNPLSQGYDGYSPSEINAMAREAARLKAEEDKRKAEEQRGAQAQPAAQPRAQTAAGNDEDSPSERNAMARERERQARQREDAATK